MRVRLRRTVAATPSMLHQQGGMRLWRSERSATAVEFALIAAPLFALLIAILETGILFISQQVLQTATTETARLIMTGQAQLGGLTAAEFLADVCNNATPVLACNDIAVNVQTFASFNAITMENPLENGKFNQAAMNYDVGGQGAIVLVQVFYELPVIDGPLGFTLANMAGNSRLLQATAVFRNEPY